MGANLLENGNFETGVVPWQSCNSGNTISVSNDAHMGNKALALEKAQNCFHQSLDLSTNNITVDTLFTLSCYAKETLSNETIRYGIYL